MYTQPRMAQAVIAPAPAAIVSPAPVSAGYGDVPWSWIIGGAIVLGATALLLSAVSAKR